MAVVPRYVLVLALVLHPAFTRSAAAQNARIAKRTRTAGHEWSIYLDARNLLNFSNIVALFAQTGDTANPLHKQQIIGAPAFPSGQYAILCVALMRVEGRFGDGDQLFTLAEQQRAFDAY